VRRRPACPPPPAGPNVTGSNRGGDRQANRALHLVAIGRIRLDPKTGAYVARKTAEGHSKLEIIRCLKRYLAREIFFLLNPGQPTIPRRPIGDTERPDPIHASDLAAGITDSAGEAWRVGNSRGGAEPTVSCSQRSTGTGRADHAGRLLGVPRPPSVAHRRKSATLN
jgi:hypothetical protein